VTLDVQAENVGGLFAGLFRAVNNLDAAGLTAATNLNLSLDDDGAADLGCGSCCLVWGVCD